MVQLVLSRWIAFEMITGAIFFPRVYTCVLNKTDLYHMGGIKHYCSIIWVLVSATSCVLTTVRMESHTFSNALWTSMKTKPAALVPTPSSSC